MIEIKNCPSSLLEGFDTYIPKSAKLLFGKTKVNPMLGFDIDEFRNVGEIADAMHRISVSGVQEKFPAIINAEAINIAGDNERSTHTTSILRCRLPHKFTEYRPQLMVYVLRPKDIRYISPAVSTFSPTGQNYRWRISLR